MPECKIRNCRIVGKSQSESPRLIMFLISPPFWAVLELSRFTTNKPCPKDFPLQRQIIRKKLKYHYRVKNEIRREFLDRSDVQSAFRVIVSVLEEIVRGIHGAQIALELLS